MLSATATGLTICLTLSSTLCQHPYPNHIALPSTQSNQTSCVKLSHDLISLEIDTLKTTK